MQKEHNDFNYMVSQFKKRLEALLAERNISRRELAQKIGISEDYLGKMMRAKRDWKVEYLKKVADVLDKPLEDLLSDSIKLPVVAEVGVGKKIDSVSFDYKAVVSPKEDKSYVLFPELPKSLMADAYVVKVIGTELMPDLTPGSHLYIARGLGNAHTLKDDDLAIYVDDKTDRAYICRIKRDDLYIHFHSLYTLPEPSEGSPLEFHFKKIAATTSGIDVVVAIILRPDLLGSK